MPVITTAFTDHLKYAVSSTDTFIEFGSATGTVDVCTTLGTPSHIFFEVYTAQGSEVVLATACEGGKVVVTRGMSGTTPKAWPVGACTKAVSVVAGQACGTGATDGDGSNCPCPDPADVFGALQVCDNINLDMSSPSAPKLCLKPTGVNAGSYCNGAIVVNEYGQITSLAPNFPSSCLPVFDFCCDGGGVGGGITLPLDSSQVYYNGPASNHYLMDGTLTDVLDTIDSVLWSLQGNISATSGVLTINTCAPASGGLSVTGTPSNPMLCLPTTALAPGVYGGFNVDAYGRITGYSGGGGATAYSFAATSPLTVNTFGTNVTYAIDSGSYSQFGAVKYTPLSDIVNNSVQPADLDNALSYQGALSLLQREAKTINAGEGLAGGGQLISDVTLALDINSLPAGVPDITYDKFAFYDASDNVHRSATTRDLALGVGSAVATLHYTTLFTAIDPASNNIANVGAFGASGYKVDLALPMPSNMYHVSVAPEGVAISWYITRINNTSFVVVFDAALAASLTGFSLTVTAI